MGCKVSPLTYKINAHNMSGMRNQGVILTDGISLLIFEEKWPNYASGPKSAPNSDSFWVRWLFNVCVRVFCAPKATILFVYIPAKMKLSFMNEKMIFFFFAKIGIFCKLIADSLSEAYTSEHTNIHTYIIGYCNPSVKIIDLVSHTTYVVCVNFIYKRRDLQFKGPLRTTEFLRNFFMADFYLLSEFLPEIC